MENPVHIVGGGLAGSECAYQLARRGLAVVLHEMRPERPTPAHKTGQLAELVCSNSFRSDDPHHAAGLLKREMETLGSLIIGAARHAAVPAGGALAVDRERYAAQVTATLEAHPLVEMRREEVIQLPAGDVVVATLVKLSGAEALLEAETPAPTHEDEALFMAVRKAVMNLLAIVEPSES